MNDLIGRLVAHPGVDRTAAKTSVGIILEFLLKEGPTETVQALTRMQGITHEIISFARDDAEEEAASEIFGRVPGLGQFI